MRVSIALARRGLLRHAGSWVLVAVIVAVSGALTLGCLAGARRTASAHDRYLRATNAADVGFESDPRCGDRPCTVDDFAQIAGVAAVSRFVRLIGALERPNGSIDTSDQSSAMMALGGGVAWGVDRPLVKDGRLPAPDASDEVFVSATFAELHHLSVDDVLSVRTFTIDEVQAVIAESDGGPKVGRTVRFRAVGVGLAGRDLVQGGLVLASEPAAELMTPLSATFAIRLERGSDGVDDFTSAVDRRFHIAPDVLPHTSDAQVQRAVRPYVVALAAYALLAALAGVVVVAQAVARQARAEGDDVPVLRAIGVTRRQRRAAVAARVVVVVLAGAVAAAFGALMASGLAPVGPVRSFETNSGVTADTTVLVAGAMAWLVFTVVGGLVGTLIADRRRSDRPALGDLPLVRRLPVTVATAVRFARPASSRGNGGAARAAVAGLATAVLMLTGAVTFAAGLHRLVDTPRLYGWTHEASIFLGYQSDDEEKAAAVDALEPQLAGEPTVAGVTELATSDVDIRGRTVPAVGAAGAGPAFTLTRGRPPAAADEVVFGSRTASRAKGATVRIGAGSTEAAYTVVGHAVFAGSTGDGAWMTIEGLHRVAPDVEVSQLGIRFVSGTTEGEGSAVLQRAGATLQQLVADPSVDVPVPPSDATSLVAIDDLPLALGVALGATALVTLTHTLLLAMRGRRRDLAILRAIGYSRRQVRTTLLLQSTLLVGAGLAIGLPLGLAAGRWTWSTWAGGLGVVDTAVTPVIFLAFMVPVSMALAALAALQPAHRASRLPVAEILRVE
jgi:hypothetical protein